MFRATKVPHFWGIKTEIQATEVVLKRPQRGRLRKGEDPARVTRYTVALQRDDLRREVVQHEQERLSTFVLITNVPPQESTAEQVLRDYHSQFLAEQNWRFITYGGGGQAASSRELFRCCWRHKLGDQTSSSARGSRQARALTGVTGSREYVVRSAKLSLPA